MRTKSPVGSLALLALLLCSPGLRGASTPTPTPAPKGKPARKLGGGSFGVPTGATPIPRPKDGGSLADIVRKTQDEAATGTRPSRGIVISNDSLGKPAAPSAGTSITITGRPGGKPVVRTPVPPPTPVEIPEYRDASGRTESDWKERAATVRERAEKADAAVGAAQAEARRLENDFYAWSDGNYRERVIRPAWDQAREKVRLLELEAEAAKAALTDLEEEARRSGTPPGWLR